jgi:hypothetical protein
MMEHQLRQYQTALADSQKADDRVKAVLARVTEEWQQAGIDTQLLAEWDKLVLVNSGESFLDSVWLTQLGRPRVDVTGRPLAAELVAAVGE